MAKRYSELLKSSSGSVTDDQSADKVGNGDCNAVRKTAGGLRTSTADNREGRVEEPLEAICPYILNPCTLLSRMAEKTDIAPSSTYCTQYGKYCN